MRESRKQIIFQLHAGPAPVFPFSGRRAGGSVVCRIIVMKFMAPYLAKPLQAQPLLQGSRSGIRPVKIPFTDPVRFRSPVRRPARIPLLPGNALLSQAQGQVAEPDQFPSPEGSSVQHACRRKYTPVLILQLLHEIHETAAFRHRRKSPAHSCG